MKNKDLKYARLMDMRIGRFVHYGIYSALGGFWKGNAAPGLGEWIQLRARIPNADYEAFAKENFLPRPDFAKNLVRAAKAAGARYIVFTSKHHDGFCLFKTAVDGYNSFDFYGRDICRELADECRKQGLGVGFYYSHTLDWHEKNAAGNVCVYNPKGTPANNRNNWDFPDKNIDFLQYFYGKCVPQVKELLTGYGPLELIWFDYPHDITMEQSKELRELVKKYQPNCLINSRIAHGMHDYVSLGDNALPTMPHGINTECLVTMNHTWGYRSDDQEWKSSAELINILARNLSAGATLLLNVGPMGDGTLTDETVQILSDIGSYARKNAEAIYGGLEPNPFPSPFDFGQVAMLDNKLFFYLEKNSKDVCVSGLTASPRRVYRVSDSASKSFEYKDGELSFSRFTDDEELSVYCAEFDTRVEISGEAKECGNVLTMHVCHAKKASRSNPDTAPTPLVYNTEHTILPGGAFINNTDKLSGWVSTDEYLIFEGEVKGGKYEAELVHALGLSATGLLVERVQARITVNGIPCDVGEEVYRRVASKTGMDNTHVIRSAGILTLPKGKVEVVLEKLADGDCIPVISVRLNRID